MKLQKAQEERKLKVEAETERLRKEENIQKIKEIIENPNKSNNISNLQVSSTKRSVVQYKTF